MPRYVSATQAKLKFGEILADVSFGKSHVVVEKQGKRLATLIPYDQYEEFLKRMSEKKLSRQELIEQISEWRKSLPPLPPGAPDAVQIIREIRQHDRFK